MTVFIAFDTFSCHLYGTVVLVNITNMPFKSDLQKTAVVYFKVMLQLLQKCQDCKVRTGSNNDHNKVYLIVKIYPPKFYCGMEGAG